MYQFRKALKKDIESIVKLVESAYRGDESRQGWTTEADLIDGQRTDKNEVTDLINAEGSQIILCEEGQQLMASVYIVNKGDIAYMGMFAVSPSSQGKGIGKALLAYIENFVSTQWQSKLIEMSVITQRLELISWYKKQGYELSGETRDFPYGDERFGIPKRDDLLLDVLRKKVE